MMDKCKTCGAIGPETPCAYPTEMVQQLQAENARLNNEVVKLREELAAEIKMRNVWQCAYEESREDLAAAQATIEQMRGVIGAWERAEAGQELQEAEAKLIAAMNAPANLDALHEALAKECERLAKAHGVGVMKWLLEEAADHRARKRATKEEGK